MFQGGVGKHRTRDDLVFSLGSFREKNARLRVLQRQETSLRTLSTGSECSQRGRRSLPVRTLTTLISLIAFTLVSLDGVASQIQNKRWLGSRILEGPAAGKPCPNPESHQRHPWLKANPVTCQRQLVSGTLSCPLVEIRDHALLKFIDQVQDEM